MKWLLLLIMAGAAVTIFMFRDELRGKIDSSTSIGESVPPEEVVSTGEGSAGSSGKSGSGKTGMGGSDERSTGSRPPVKESTAKANQRPPTPDEVAQRYPMPKFKSIGEAVGNWNSIPSSAFPRPIKINKALKIVLPGGVGSSTLPANSDVFALASRGGVVTVGKTKDASARGQIGIDDTTYKQVLTAEFDRWKSNQEAIVMKKRARFRNVVAQAKAAEDAVFDSSGTTNKDYEAELGRKPKQNPDGVVPLMIASLERGDTTEIKPGIIKRWGPVIREVVDGEAYWTSSVEYTTVSMFGELSTEAQALIKHGKVLQWVYTGSGESVP